MFAGLLVICGWLMYEGAVATMRGHFLTTVIVVGWVAPMLAAAAAIGRASLGRTALRTDVDVTGTTVFPDRWLSILMFGALAMLIPAGILFVIYVPRGAVDLSMSRGMQIFSPVLMAGAVVTAVVGLLVAWRRGGMGYLKLAPSGLEIANVAFTTFVAWEDVIDVKDHAETKKTRKAVVLCRRDGKEEVIEGMDLYVARGVPLYWMVRHYWRHPEERRELIDGRALQRLHDERFDVA